MQLRIGPGEADPEEDGLGDWPGEGDDGGGDSWPPSHMVEGSPSVQGQSSSVQGKWAGVPQQLPSAGGQLQASQPLLAEQPPPQLAPTVPAGQPPPPLGLG